MTWELLLELVRIYIEFLNHLVDILDMVLKVIFRVFNSFVPEHGKIALDVSLGNCRIRYHFEISTSHLPSKNQSLAFH